MNARLSSDVRVNWPSGRCPVPRHAGTGGAGGVVFCKLSKLLNQEDALSAPLLCGDFRSPGAPRGGAGMLRRGVIRYCRINVCGHRVITLASADDFPVVGGRCTGRASRCKATQGRRGKTALRYEYLIAQ